MTSWFYTDALATQQGPVDDATLLELNRAGEIKAKSLVWREGLESWTPFRNVAAALFTAVAGDSSESSGGTGSGDAPAPIEIGVCAHSGRVYPLAELLPYGEALVGPEHKDDFVRRLMEGAAVEIADATSQAFDYVGFWWRVLAATLDYMIKMVPSGIFMVPYYAAAIYSGAQPSAGADSFEGLTGMTALMLAAYGFGLLGMLAFSIAYDTWMVGRYQATLGKIIIGAKVVNPDGSRLSYKRAFARWFVKKPLIGLIVWGPSTLGFALVVGFVAAMSGRGGDNAGAGVLLAMMTGMFAYAALLALCSGVYWMAAFDPEKRTLHDRIAGTRVVRK